MSEHLWSNQRVSFWWDRGVKRNLNNDLDFICPELCKQGVTGSIPVTSTNFFSDCKTLTEFIFSPTPRFSCAWREPLE
jgi:hypothetical protein